MKLPEVFKRNSYIAARVAGALVAIAFITGVAWTGSHRQKGSQAQSCGACIQTVSAPEVHSTYHVWLSSIGDAGSRTTPYTLASTANYQLKFESTAAGYAFDHWHFSYNNSNNSNTTVYFSGSTYANSTITINLKYNLPPGGVSLSSPSQTTSSIALNFSATGADSYTLTRGSTVLLANSTATSYNDTGLSCGTTYSYTVTAKNAKGSSSASKNVATSACPAPPPSNSGSSGGSTTGGTASGSTTTTRSTPASPRIQGSSNTNQASQADTTPPAKPANFKAELDKNSASVQLSWDAVIDTSGIKAYQLDRSTDQNNWQTLTSDKTDTTYLDTTTSFSTHYFYRVRATDNAGNTSDFAAADVATPAFAANAFPDQDNTINDETNNIAVTIPKGALDEAAQCSVVANPNILSPSLKGYKAVDGPYELVCKNLAGAQIAPVKPFSISWTTSAGARNGIKQVDYFGYKDGNWQSLKVTARNKKNRTDQVAVDGATVFAAMGKLKHTPLLVKILLIFLVLAAIGALAFFVLIIRVRRQQQSRYDDYIHKEYGI